MVINYFKNRLTEDLSSNDVGPENFWNGGPWLFEPIGGKDENGGGGTDVITDCFCWLEEANSCCCWKFDWAGTWPK